MKGTGRSLLWVWAGLLASAWAWVYLPSLSIGFVSDDYQMLLLPSLLPSKDWYRYSPVGVAIWHVLAPISRSPWLYRAVALLLHASVILMVFALARRMKASMFAGLLAATLFLGRREHHEVVFWSSAGLFYMPMALAFVTALFVAAREPARPGLRYVVVYPLLVAVAVFSHESGLFLVPALALAELTRTVRPPAVPAPIAVRLLRLVPMTLPALALVAIKQMVSMPVPALASKLYAALAAIDAFYAMQWMVLPFSSSSPIWLPELWIAAGLSAAVLAGIGIALLWIPGGRPYAGPYAAVVLCFFSIRMHLAFQDRFLYMPTAVMSVLVACGVASLMDRWGERLSRRRTQAVGPWRFAPHTAAAVIVIAVSASEAASLVKLRALWGDAAVQCREVAGKIADAVIALEPQVQRVYLLDPPDYLPTTGFRTCSVVYVFRAGVEAAAWLAQLEREAAGRSKSPPRQVVALRPHDALYREVAERGVSDPAVRVLRYDAVRRSIVPCPVNVSAGTGP